MRLEHVLRLAQRPFGLGDERRRVVELEPVHGADRAPRGADDPAARGEADFASLVRGGERRTDAVDEVTQFRAAAHRGRPSAHERAISYRSGEARTPARG